MHRPQRPNLLETTHPNFFRWTRFHSLFSFLRIPGLRIVHMSSRVNSRCGPWSRSCHGELHVIISCHVRCRSCSTLFRCKSWEIRASSNLSGASPNFAWVAMTNLINVKFGVLGEMINYLVWPINLLCHCCSVCTKCSLANYLRSFDYPERDCSFDYEMSHRFVRLHGLWTCRNVVLCFESNSEIKFPFLFHSSEVVVTAVGVSSRTFCAARIGCNPNTVSMRK
jgi:hypothetical protein